MKTLVFILLLAVCYSPGAFAQKADQKGNQKASQKVQEHDITAWLKQKDKKERTENRVKRGKGLRAMRMLRSL